MEDEYVGDEKFYECIELLKKSSQEGKFTDETKQEIYETIQCYITNKHRLDPETVNCLFTGYFVRQLMLKNNEQLG